jgi:predicted transcriptional regulator of viral defense system
LKINVIRRTQTASARLHDSALAQGGFFTARQARDAGYADNVHLYHVRTGHWIREIRGVYRLAQFPLGTRPELMLWQLWSRNRQDEPQGVFSHATALSLHDLTDLMPAKLDMTVPHGFRRMAAIPAVLRLHHAKLAAREIETMSGVRVTTMRRTLIDIIGQGAIAPEMQVQAVEQAIRRGLILRRELESARVSTRARRRIARILKLVPDDRPETVRHRKRAAHRARSTPLRSRSS